MYSSRKVIIPETILSLVKDMNGANPPHVLENYRNRLSDIASYIENEVHAFDERDRNRRHKKIKKTYEK